MIVDLKHQLSDQGGPQLSALRALLQQLAGGASIRGQCIKEEAMQRSNVFRLAWEADGDDQRFVVKRFLSACSTIERNVISRWLPQVGLAHLAPHLLGVAREPSGRHVWHVYEDLGDGALDQKESENGRASTRDRGFLSPLQVPPDRDHVSVVVRLAASLHDAFLNHSLLAECRTACVELGSRYLESSVHDAMGAVETLRSSHVTIPATQAVLLDALLDKLRDLHEQLSWRRPLLDRLGGPDTLLHGDLGVQNAFVLHRDHGLDGRLIDWDHAGVGPASYDLSTLLMQLPAADRIWTLDAYLENRHNASAIWPTHEEWNLLFESHEYARLANCVIWPAKAAMEGEVAWALEELAGIKGWFDALRPTLPVKNEGKHCGKALYR